MFVLYHLSLPSRADNHLMIFFGCNLVGFRVYGIIFRVFCTLTLWFIAVVLETQFCQRHYAHSYKFTQGYLDYDNEYYSYFYA